MRDDLTQILYDLKMFSIQSADAHNICFDLLISCRSSRLQASEQKIQSYKPCRSSMQISFLYCDYSIQLVHVCAIPRCGTHRCSDAWESPPPGVGNCEFLDIISRRKPMPAQVRTYLYVQVSTCAGMGLRHGASC